MAEPERRSLPRCPVETTLMLLSDKWKVLILRDLQRYGTMRFSALKRSIGSISQKVLTANLRSMEADGLDTSTTSALLPFSASMTAWNTLPSGSAARMTIISSIGCLSPFTQKERAASTALPLLYLLLLFCNRL